MEARTALGMENRHLAEEMIAADVALKETDAVVVEVRKQ